MKRLVFCSDGTWNRASDRHPTNVLKVSRALTPLSADGARQLVRYDEGVGTDGGLLDKLVGGATGAGLSKNVGDAYRFLAQNHEEGDEVFLFGYSRGAYTVRSAVGLIRTCGLLKPEHLHRFDEAYRIYRTGKGADAPAAQAFRTAYSRSVNVRFLGVWDTVGALGIPGVLAPLLAWNHRFHDVKLSSIVKEAYQAVAIDERRLLFQPTLWETKNVPGQTVEQAWFAGAHSNVGGGHKDSGLSDLALIWMMKRAERAGLTFDGTYLKEILQEDPAGSIDDSSRGLWHYLGVGRRTIGDKDHQPQEVDSSALQRRANESLRYRPPNLEAYLKRHGKA